MKNDSELRFVSSPHGGGIYMHKDVPADVASAMASATEHRSCQQRAILERYWAENPDGGPGAVHARRELVAILGRPPLSEP